MRCSRAGSSRAAAAAADGPADDWKCSAIAEKAISIQITLQNDSLVLKVEDDGAGYPLSLVQNGPNPFETTSSNSSHFGMGLYSSRILCEKHGGRLILGNQAGGGASATAIFHFV